MAQKIDLYSILMAYANRYGSPSVDINGFLVFLEKYANHQVREHPEWQKWTREVPVKFWAELAPLIEAGKCEVQNNAKGEGSKVYLCSWHTDLIEQAYRSIDDTAAVPFPDEKHFKFSLPPDQVRIIKVGIDLFTYLGDPQESSSPIIRLVFPEDLGTTLILAPMIPRKLLEAAILKIRNFLHSHGGRDYAMHKLPSQVADRQIYLRDLLNQIQARPLDCIQGLEEAENFANLFWACFCSLVKNEVRREKERSAEDIAAIQAAFLIEIFNGFYKAAALKVRDRELAFKNLDSRLDKPPCLYTLDEIIRFTNAKGVLLLGQYSQGELETWIKTKTTESHENGMPELLIISGKNGERWFIKKKNIFPACAKLLVDAKAQIKQTLERRWFRMLTDYRREPAMESDREFEQLLSNYTGEMCETLCFLLNDAKLPVLYREMELAGTILAELSNLYVKGQLVPFAELYGLKRKEILTNLKLLLPFWYSIPILVSFLSLFSGMKKKNKRPQRAAGQREEGNAAPGEKDSLYELRQAGQKLESAVVPGDYSTGDYLKELENRWNPLIDTESRNRLVEDVKAVTRDYLRFSLRNLKNVRFTRHYLDEMGTSIVSGSGALKKINDQKSLHTYIVVYLTQLLLTIKF